MWMTTPNRDEAQVKLEGKHAAVFFCWLLGLGCLLPYNSMQTIVDYYVSVFPRYHPSRVLNLVYQPFAFGTIATLAYYEAKVNTRLRNLSGYSLNFLNTLSVLIINVAASREEGIGTFIGICVLSGISGIGSALAEGGILGDLSLMLPEFVQSFCAGQAAAGAITSGLRLVTKAAFENSNHGLRNGALLFLTICAVFELFCFLLYAFVFAKLPIVKFYRTKAAYEGSKTVTADLVAGGIYSKPGQDAEDPVVQERLSNRELLTKNIDYAVDIFLTYILTISIFPGFLAEDTGKHNLDGWYVVVLIAIFNVWDLIGSYIPYFESRKGLMIVTLSRFLLVPAFYFTAKYGDQGWMIMLTSFLGVTNGYLTVSVLASAPKGYKGPEQNALANILLFFLMGGLCGGAILNYLWLIGKGW